MNSSLRFSNVNMWLWTRQKVMQILNSGRMICLSKLNVFLNEIICKQFNFNSRRSMFVFLWCHKKHNWLRIYWNDKSQNISEAENKKCSSVRRNIWFYSLKTKLPYLKGCDRMHNVFLLIWHRFLAGIWNIFFLLQFKY